MEYIVDFHTHSHYSRATSRESTLEGLYRWGKIKGIHIIGAGDFTHPLWFSELQEKLEPAEAGLFRLKPELARAIDENLPALIRGTVIRFVLTSEIATVYKRGGRVRKLHQLVVMPNFVAVANLNSRLGQIGNLRADGRPILGMDSKELLRLVLETDREGLYIPAHIWTPWFGLFGSKSGFDSFEEAYEELASEVRAIETGLSSDPFMNWRVSKLGDRAITSHSDGHSPHKLGREATRVEVGQLDYGQIMGALRTNDERLVGTIEFFPEEGKYHSDGHRACGVRFSPKQTKAHGGRCPVCGKALVVGVQYRINELADRPLSHIGHKRVEYIVPLAEMLAELQGVKGAGGRGVMNAYHELIAGLGSEFEILRHVPLETIGERSPVLAEAIKNVRTGRVQREPGYDGVYGTIRTLTPSPEKTG